MGRSCLVQIAVLLCFINIPSSIGATPKALFAKCFSDDRLLANHILTGTSIHVNICRTLEKPPE